MQNEINFAVTILLRETYYFYVSLQGFKTSVVWTQPVRHPWFRSVHHRGAFFLVLVMLTGIHTPDCHPCFNTNPPSLFLQRMKQRLLLMAAARYVNVSNTVFMFSTSEQLYSTSVYIQVEGRIHHSPIFHLFYLSRPFVSVSSKGKSKCLPDIEYHNSSHRCSSLSTIFQIHCTAEIKE